jgi:hypothetical protein
MVAVALVSLLAAVTPALGQSRGGVLLGTVLDRSGATVPGARVELAGRAVEFTFDTGPDGQYRFLHLSPGEYEVRVSRPGFQPARVAGLRLGDGDVLSLAVILEVEGVEQAIEVGARRVQSGSLASFTADHLGRLPAPSYPAALVAAVPGVVADRVDVGGSESHQRAQFVFRGSRMLDTVWSIDGVVVTDRQTGNPPGFYDLEAFDEIRFAATSSDVAQPGAGLGVNMVVRSGTNQLRVTTRGSFTGAVLQASNLRAEMRAAPFFVTPGQADHTRQIGEYAADAGGPLRRGRAWFWGSGARRDSRLVRLSGGHERTVLTPRTLKLNWQVTPRDRLNWLWLDHGMTRFGVNPSALRAPLTARQNHSALYPDNPFRGLWKIEDQRIVLPSLFAAARYAYYGTGFQQVSIGSGPAGISPRLGETVGATSSSWSLRPQHTAAADGSYFRSVGQGSHAIRFGASWQRLDMLNRTLWPGHGIVAFHNSLTDQRARIHREQSGRNRLHFMSAYVSDTLSAGRLTVDLGLRSDRQRAEALASRLAGNPAFPDLIAAVEYPRERVGSWVELSPRAAATYALDTAGRTVLRVSGGRFAPPLVMGNVAQLNPTNAPAWIEYPWEDRNGDRLAQPEEVRIDLPALASQGFNPQDPGSVRSPNADEPGMRWRSTSGMSVAIQREFAPHLAGTIGYNYSRHTRWPYQRWRGLTSDDYTRSDTQAVLPDGTRVSVPVYLPDARKIREHGAVRVFDTRDSYYSTYHGIDASLTRRLSDGWMLSASGAWNNSRAFYRTTPPLNSLGNPTRLDGSTGAGPLGGPGDPLVHGGQLAPATMPAGGGGVVFLNARWQVNLTGAYVLPRGFEAAGTLFGRQGTPSPSVIQHPLGPDGNRAVLVSPRVDSVRLDNVWNLDLRLAKRVRHRRVAVQATGDLLNVLNGRAALVRERNLGSPHFGRVDMTVSPRTLRLALRISY